MKRHLNPAYTLYYYFYRLTNKLGLWRLYHAVDEEFGIPYVEAKWFFQDKEGMTRL